MTMRYREVKEKLAGDAVFMLFGTVKVAAVLLSISVMHYAAPPTYRAVRDWSSVEMGVSTGYNRYR